MKALSKTERTLSAREFGEYSKTPEEVARQVKEDFRLRGMSLSDAAKKLGVFRQVVSVQLSGKSYLSKIASDAYKRVFGFSYDFLRFGHGYMYEDTDLNNIFLGDCDNDYDIARKIRERELFVKNQKEKEFEGMRAQYLEMNSSYEILDKDYRDLQKQFIEQSQSIVRILVRYPQAVEALRPPKEGEKEIPDTDFAKGLYQYMLDKMPSSAKKRLSKKKDVEDL